MAWITPEVLCHTQLTFSQVFSPRSEALCGRVMKQAVFCIKEMVSSKDTQIFCYSLQIEWGIVAFIYIM